MLPQDTFVPRLRILGNLTSGLEVQGMVREDAPAYVLPLLPDFGLDGFEKHYPPQLSCGMG